jgi:CBS domain-containing protein
MTVLELCSTPAVTAHREETIVDAARRIRDRHVGDLVVVDKGDRPVGILTDRDIVVSAVAQSADRLDVLRVADVMSTNVITIGRLDTAEDALKKMATHGIRRLPMVDHEGRVEGIVTLDDLLQRESLQLWNSVTVVAKEQRKERQRCR